MTVWFIIAIMNKKLWIIFAVVVVLGLGGLIFWQQNNEGQKNENAVPAIDPAPFKDISNGVITNVNVPASYTGDKSLVTDNATGKLDSKVVVIEYADYQCPGCYSLSPTMKSITDEYSDRVAFVYRYFPLYYHPNGYASAVASEAAARQGKFWPMHDLLFENKPNWENASVNKRESVFAGYAEQIGLDMEQWRADYQNFGSNGIKTKIDFQQNMGKEDNGVTATPWVIVNGQQIQSPTEDALKSAIDEALKK